MPLPYNQAKEIVEQVIEDYIIENTAIREQTFHFNLIPSKPLNEGWGAPGPNWKNEGASIIEILKAKNASTFGSVSVDVSNYLGKRLSFFRAAILETATTS